MTRADAIAALDVLAWLEMERQETQTRKGTLLGRYDRMTATDASRRKKRGLKRLRVQGPEREARNETSSFRFTCPPGQKPDALALMGCAGDWIVMPEATKLSVSMIVSFSAFSPHCKLSDLTDSLSALSI